MTPASHAAHDASALLQVIDEEKNFTDRLASALHSPWAMDNCGLDYNAVAIIGSQSTGKSTILNRLFGTSFDTMDDRGRRKQTTKGIWMAKSTSVSPPPHTLVIDVEGTDGRERGEDQDFERKSTLFALAIAEVVIVNLWENAIGLYNGANMALLKTVLEVNLQLFQREDSDSTKTHLFFLIRDHASNTPLDALATTIKEDLAGIWQSITSAAAQQHSVEQQLQNKSHIKTPSPSPTTLVSESSAAFSLSGESGGDSDEPDLVLVKKRASSHAPRAVPPFESLFEVTVASLPHMKLMRDSFESECKKLRTRFTNPSDSKYVFRPGCRKSVPADGFACFAESIWAKIIANKDLDLPTQQELLAQFRCDELAAAASAEFAASCADLAASAGDHGPGGSRPVSYCGNTLDNSFVFSMAPTVMTSQTSLLTDLSSAGGIGSGGSSSTTVATQVIPQLGTKLDTLCANALVPFDERAKRYNSAVYLRKRDELLDSMRLHANATLFAPQARNAHREALELLRTRLDTAASRSADEASKMTTCDSLDCASRKNTDSDSTVPTFAESESIALREAKRKISNILKESTMSGADWDTRVYVKQFLSEAKTYCQQRRSEVLDAWISAVATCSVAELRDKLDKTIVPQTPSPSSAAATAPKPDRDRDSAKVARNHDEIELESIGPSKSSIAFSKSLVDVLLFKCAQTTLDRTISTAESHALPSRGMRRRSRAKLAAELVRGFEAGLRASASGTTLEHRLRRDFELRFKYDKKQMPRVWRSGQHELIEKTFSISREPSLTLLASLANLEINERKLSTALSPLLEVSMLEPERQEKLKYTPTSAADADDGNCAGTGDEMMSPVPESPITSSTDESLAQLARVTASLMRAIAEIRSAATDASARFRLESDAMFMETKRSMVTTTNTVPTWVIVLIIVLGWNEFVYLVTSPLVLIAVVFLSVVAVVLHYAGLLGTALALGSRGVASLARAGGNALVSFRQPFQGVASSE